MKSIMFALVLVSLPAISFAQGKSPTESTDGSKSRTLSSEEVTLEKNLKKKCGFAEERLSDGTCTPKHENIRPMRPDRR